MLESSRPSLDVNEPLPKRELSGRKLVFGLLMLGILATALMFVYWEQHTRPFRSLREAVGREFRHSRPNVEGGRSKGKGPWILRVSMSVDFPATEEPERGQEIGDRVLELVKQHVDHKDLERVEVNLIQFVPQELAKTKTYVWDADELAQPGTRTK